MPELQVAPDLNQNEKKKWWILSVASAGVLLATIDASIVNIALPTLSDYFAISVRVIAWVTISYMLIITAFLLVFGRLSDIFGNKPVFVLGMAIFTVGSALCALSVNVGQLIAFRIFQGFGAAMIMSNTAAIVTSAFPPKQRGMGLGAIGSAVSIGLMLGPPLGGLIINYLGWRYIFLVNVPVGIFGVALSMKVLSSRESRSKMNFPLLDSALWISGIVIYVMIFGITGESKVGIAAASAAGILAAAVILIFFKRQFNSGNPLFAPELLKNITFLLSCGAGFFMYMGMIGVSFMLPFFLERSIGFSPLQTGRFLMIIPATTVIMSPLSGALSDKLGQRPIASFGTLLATVSLFFMLSFNQDSGTVRMAVNLAAMGIGIGMFGSPNNSALMGSVSDSLRGSAAGILATVRNLGFVTGAAVVSLIFNIALKKGIAPETADYAAAFVSTLPLPLAFIAIAFIFSLLRKSV
jgi:EmrB/QacA subfamily drug resistance transporter